jgi:hypothetical protein
MIIVRLKGGLGNQMFQYATARHLAVKNGTCLKLDLSSFSRNRLRSYRLNHYNIAARPASAKELIRFGVGHRKMVRWALRAIAGWLPRNDWQWIVQKGRDYDPSLLKLRGNVYLEGTWQSAKYFHEISPLVRQELMLKTRLSRATLRVAEEITKTEAVSLHVRRGDYVSDMTTNKKHGLCGLDYYEHAMHRIAQETPTPHFFVFSDDPTWTRNHLSSKYPMTFVTHNGPEQDYEDLYLVSMCRHHIVANSTFSWWGAWLCKNDDKVVIAPRQWFRGVEFNVGDLIPSNWCTI